MSDLAFLVATALADRPLHGYAILQEIDEMTRGSARPQVATLYRTLDRMRAEGTIVEHGEEVVNGRFRRTYRLTADGRALLATEASMRASTARIAKRRLDRPVTEGMIAGGAS